MCHCTATDRAIRCGTGCLGRTCALRASLCLMGLPGGVLPDDQNIHSRPDGVTCPSPLFTDQFWSSPCPCVGCGVSVAHIKLGETPAQGTENPWWWCWWWQRLREETPSGCGVPGAAAHQEPRSRQEGSLPSASGGARPTDTLPLTLDVKHLDLGCLLPQPPGMITPNAGLTLVLGFFHAGKPVELGQLPALSQRLGWELQH